MSAEPLQSVLFPHPEFELVGLRVHYFINFAIFYGESVDKLKLFFKSPMGTGFPFSYPSVRGLETLCRCCCYEALCVIK